VLRTDDQIEMLPGLRPKHLRHAMIGTVAAAHVKEQEGGMIQMGVGTARLMAAKFQKLEQRGQPVKTSTVATGLQFHLHPRHPR